MCAGSPQLRATYRLGGVHHGEHKVAGLHTTGTYGLRPPLSEESGHGGLVREAKFAHVLGEEKYFNTRQGRLVGSNAQEGVGYGQL